MRLFVSNRIYCNCSSVNFLLMLSNSNVLQVLMALRDAISSFNDRFSWLVLSSWPLILSRKSCFFSLHFRALFLFWRSLFSRLLRSALLISVSIYVSFFVKLDRECSLSPSDIFERSSLRIFLAGLECCRSF
jgi:hypothetical protein